MQIEGLSWFPGHMTKTKRMIVAEIKNVDAVCEILDARIPLSSRNPDVDEMTTGKPRLVVLNRVDQADPRETKRWAAYFRGKGYAVLEANAKGGVGTAQFAAAVRELLKDKLAAYDIETISVAYSGDGVENVTNAVTEARKTGADVILCTGGMSVDPDDNTPGGIQASGARIVTYGAPVLPGAMFLLGYFEDGTPICGLPGCVMYAGATIFDLTLPRIAAGVELTCRDFAVMGEGGLCLGCKPCHWPDCPFGK